MEPEKSTPQKVRIVARNRWLLLAAMVSALALIAALLFVKVPASTNPALERQSQQPQTLNQPLTPAPGFTLSDQQGRTTSLAQFRGKVVVLTFIDPECHQLCPLTTHSMVQAINLLGPAAASHVQLIGINANPLKTQVSDVANYTRTHDLEGLWRFLTGPRVQLEQIWRDYHIYVAVMNNDIEHTAIIMLIGPNGNERNIYFTPMSYSAEGGQEQTLAAGIRSLLPGHPSDANANQITPDSEELPPPVHSVSLTPLSPKQPPVELGSAHAHLAVFFASWLGQDSNLHQNLSVLDSYAALAERRGWPSPVAIDELTTEPSPTVAQQVIDPLAATLRTPIVEDASGRLADNFHVDDLPWFVLSSSSGKILWHHDGWLSASALKQQVTTALAKS